MPNTPFTYGERVNDPVAIRRNAGEEHLIQKLSVDLCLEDVIRLKSTTATRGNIQLTISTLVHSFCTVLRDLGITDYTCANDFHFALAVWAGRAVNTGTLPIGGKLNCTNKKYNGGVSEPLLAILPSEVAEHLCRAFCRGTTAQTGGDESRTDDSRRTPSVRGKTTRAKKKSSSSQRTDS